MSGPAVAKDAATVILLRPTAANGFEVLLTRRPKSMPFLGDMYCFPGGTVGKEDYRDTMLRRSRGLAPSEARAILGARYSPRRALGFWIAAVRELFEEVGVLIAVDENGRPVGPDAERNARLTQKRQQMYAGSFDFLSILQSESLFCDLSRLIYFSHWQTPARDPLRFDTLFFLTELRCEDAAAALSDEVVDSRWIAPDNALQLFARGELPMILPTYATLRTLADFATIESVAREFRHSSGRPSVTTTN